MSTLYCSVLSLLYYLCRAFTFSIDFSVDHAFSGVVSITTTFVKESGSLSSFDSSSGQFLLLSVHLWLRRGLYGCHRPWHSS